MGARVVLNKLKKRADKSDGNSGAIIGSALATVSSPIIARLPKMASLTRDVQRARKVNVEAVEKPQSRKDFVIP